MLINFYSIRMLVMIREKRGNNDRKTAKIGICTPLKFEIYFGLV